jgi:hypothetical protein
MLLKIIVSHLDRIYKITSYFSPNYTFVPQVVSLPLRFSDKNFEWFYRLSYDSIKNLTYAI